MPSSLRLLLLTILVWSPAAFAQEIPLRRIGPSVTPGTSQAVVVGDVPLVHTSQVLPPDDRGRGGDAEAQATLVLDRLQARLRQARSSLERVVKLNVYAVDDEAAAAAFRAVAARFTGEEKPAFSLVLTGLPQDDALVAMDAVAASAATESTRDGVGVEGLSVLPPGRKIFVAGQAEKADNLQTATQKTMESLDRTLEFLGRAKKDIVQLKCFVTPLTAESVKEVEAGMKAVLGDGPLPPVVFVEWKSSLPIEIELVAWGGPIEEGMPAIEYVTPPGMTTSPIYSRVARTASKETIYISGLFADRGPDARLETGTLFAGLGSILRATGSDFLHLAKATYYVSTEEASAELNSLRPKYYDPQRPPAASKAMVRGVGLPGRATTMDMIAVPGN